MKKGFTTLVILFLLLYGKVGYEIYLENRGILTFSKGNLSRIAEKVEAVSLRNPPGGELQQITKIRSWDNHLFLVSEGILYQYSRQGEYICRITEPSEIWVAEYLIDPISNQLIVLGNEADIWYYDRKGNLLEKKVFTKEHPDEKLLTVAIHGDRIWFVKETVEGIDGGMVKTEKKLVEYDTSMICRHSYPLHIDPTPSLGKNSFSFSPRMAVCEDTGKIYVYTPAVHPEYLLTDTLQLLYNEKKALLWGNEPGIPVYPFRLGGRFLLSQGQMGDKNYFYCYDRKLKKSWNLTDGFTDNFYHTGPIHELQPLDLYNRHYCFTRSPEELPSFLAGKSSAGGQTLFIVTLKG